MKTRCLFVFFAIVVSNCFPIFSFGQNSKIVSGVIIDKYETKSGTITIQYPEQVLEGETISGRIIVTPESDKPGKQTKQLKELESFAFMLGEKIPVKDGVFVTRIPASSLIPVQLINSVGSLVSEKFIVVVEDVEVQKLRLSKTVRLRNIEKISGDFKGDITQAQLSFDGQPARLIAGNGRELFYKAESVEPGKSSMVLEYDDNQVETEVNLIDYSLEVGKLDLNRGEKTHLAVKVVGLEDLAETLSFEVQNLSDATVTLEGGERQILEIIPEEVAESGVWERRFEIQSIKNGTFSINTSLDIPEPIEYHAPGEIIDCEIGGYSVLVTAEVCEKLQKEYDSKISEYPAEMAEDVIPEPEITVSEIGDELGGIIDETIDIQYPSDVNGLAYRLVDFETSEMLEEVFVETVRATNRVQLDIPVETGVYKLEYVVSYGENLQFSITRYINQIPVMGPDAVVLNIQSDYERQRDHLERQIEDIERRLEGNEEARRQNRREAAAEDSEAQDENEVVRQLEEIDFVLDEVEGAFSRSLRQVIDSLIYYANNIPEPDLDALKKQVDDLKAALDACHDQLARLKEQNRELLSQIKDAGMEHRAQWEELRALFDEAGYSFSGGQMINSRGDLAWGYAGSEMPKPQELQEAEDEIWSEMRRLNRLHKNLRASQANLPQQIAATAAQCDQIAAELEAAKNALDEGNSVAATVQIMNTNRDEFCRQIKNILERLSQWCDQNPDMCEELSEMIDEFMRNCPRSERELREFWSSWERILTTKQGIERQHNSEGERHSSAADQLREQNQTLENDEASLLNRLNQLREELDNAWKAHLAALESARRARINEQRERCQACREFMEEHNIPEDQIDHLQELWELKNEISQITDMVEDATGQISRLTSNDGIGQFCNAFGGKLRRMKNILEKLDKIEGMQDMANEIGEVLDMLQNPGNTPEERADNFLKWLDKTGDVLSLAGDIPILGFVVTYFTEFMIPAAHAIVGGAQDILDERAAALLEDVNGLNCDFFVNNYKRTGTVDAVVDMVKSRFGYDAIESHEVYNSLENQLNEYVEQKIMECCLDQLASSLCRD